MRGFTQLTITLCFFLTLSACVPNQYQQNLEPISLLKQSQSHIQSASVVIGLDPNNSRNFIPQQQVAANQQGGLLGAIIASAITNSMNNDLQAQAALMTPIKNAAIEYNFGSQYRQKLAKTIKKLKWFQLNSVTKTPEFQRANPEYLTHQFKGDSIIVSDVFYKMAEDFSKITFTSYVCIYPNNDMLKKLARKYSPEKEHPVLFQKKFSHDYRFEGQYYDASQAASNWAKNNARMVRRAFDKGINSLSNLIANDLHL